MRRLLRHALILAPLLTLLACERAVDDDVESVRVPIIDGQRNPGDPAVMVLAIETSRGSSLCTGSLIAPRVVLTAKHCICDNGTGRPVAGSAVQIGTGASLEEATLYARGTEVRTTPGACSDDISSIVGSDIALVLLDREGSLMPLRIVRDRPAAVGDRITAIGYGVTEAGFAPDEVPAGLSGTKMSSTATVIEIALNELAIDGPTTCYGDSGGPGFLDDGRVAGVVSRGEGFCTGAAVYTRVDAFLSLIDDAIADTGGSVPDPTPEPEPEPTPEPDPTPDPPSDAGAPIGADAGVGPRPQAGDQQIVGTVCTATPLRAASSIELRVAALVLLLFVGRGARRRRR